MYRSFLSDFEKDSILETESRENLKITSRTRPFESLAGLLLALTTRFPRQRDRKLKIWMTTVHSRPDVRWGREGETRLDTERERERDGTFSKGTYRGWYFILGPLSPLLYPLRPWHLPGLLLGWCRSRRTTVSSARQTGLEAWSDGFHDSMGSPQSTLTPSRPCCVSPHTFSHVSRAPTYTRILRIFVSSVPIPLPNSLSLSFSFSVSMQISIYTRYTESIRRSIKPWYRSYAEQLEKRARKRYDCDRGKENSDAWCIFGEKEGREEGRKERNGKFRDGVKLSLVTNPLVVFRRIFNYRLNKISLDEDEMGTKNGTGGYDV